MKYQLETIPVWDACRAEPECPLCLLSGKAEQDYERFFLGGSVMVPEVRVQVNRTGFCPRHLLLLLRGDNRLGLALMLRTHLGGILERLRREKRADGLRACLREQAAGCLICERIDERLKRYSFTLLHLWRTDPEFRALLDGSRGFCLAHLPVLLEVAREVLSGRKLAEWMSFLLPLQERGLERLAAELEAFTRSFGYDHDGGVGPEARGALERAVRKLAGRSMEDPL